MCSQGAAGQHGWRLGEEEDHWLSVSKGMSWLLNVGEIEMWYSEDRGDMNNDVACELLFHPRAVTDGSFITDPGNWERTQVA